jgi:hypothetical protein
MGSIKTYLQSFAVKAKKNSVFGNCTIICCNVYICICIIFIYVYLVKDLVIAVFRMTALETWTRKWMQWVKSIVQKEMIPVMFTYQR